MNINITMNNNDCKDCNDVDFKLLNERRSFMFKMIAFFAGVVYAGYLLTFHKIPLTNNGVYILYPWILSCGLFGVISIGLYLMYDSISLKSVLQVKHYCIYKELIENTYNAFVTSINTWGILSLFVFIVVAVCWSQNNVYELLQASMQTLEKDTISIYDFITAIIMYTSIVFFVFICIINVAMFYQSKKYKNIDKWLVKTQYILQVIFYAVFTLFLYAILLRTQTYIYYQSEPIVESSTIKNEILLGLYPRK